ncbi:MAG: anhydro-N-acetylmuramic acid kinase [Crocinitomicaceae bacterium]
MEKATILGLMSGTSLDGLDLCLVNFEQVDNQYQFQILETKSVQYSAEMQQELRDSVQLKAEGLKKLDIKIGIYFAQEVNSFIKQFGIKPQYIASHGHTVFHQPENGFTTQIGNGNTLFSETKIPVICDFRSLDVALGGQGAPLVPIGDLYLFSQYAACINFGGIANFSFQQSSSRFAHDICPVNMALSDLTVELNLPYDDQGKIARTGKVNKKLLDELNGLEFYKESGPKSLGVEWYRNHFKKLIKNSNIQLEDRLRTVIEHIAVQVSNALTSLKNGEVLVTGGGVFNTFLIEILQSKVHQRLVVPSRELVEFKEALIFAFLGWLKVNSQINVLKTVTGASSNSCSGILIK